MFLNHPPKDQLIAFGQGMLTADESSHVEQHLEECHDCCATLLDLKDDTFVGLVKIASAKMADAADVRTDPGTDANDFRHESVLAATILEQSCETVGPDELPPELAGHLRYDIVELIGRGGMGNVYRAEHRLMNRPVAIKLINSQLIRQPQAVERFRLEVQAAAKLSHPNIVTAYDAEQAGGVHFLVMEFVEGTDLASVVKSRGPMSVAEACDCIRQAAVGLQHAHEKGMVHRDIKPHNLMLSAEGQVRILDFGLAGFTLECGGSTPLSLAAEPLSLAPAHSSESLNGNDKESDSVAPQSGVEPPHSKALTTAGSVMGTPDYIAPEQAADAHSADIRSDIYSLGCTLHFLLTGKPPFEAENVLAKLKAHANEPPPEMTKLRNDVPAELSKVVQRMMAKNPAERFQTPAAIAEALAPFAEPSASPPMRRIGRAIEAALLLAAMILAAVVIYVQTDTGEFEIHASDEVAVQIENSRVKIRDKITGRDYQLTAGKHSIRKGEYVINVTELPDGLTVDTNKFSLTRGGKAKVTVSFKPKESPAAKTDRGDSQPAYRSDFAEVGRFMRHEGSASHAIFSPSGRYGISCGADKTIRVWDIATQEEKRVLKGHEGSVFGLAISTDGKLLASCDNAKSIRLWNLETGEQVGELTGHTDAVTDLAFMPDRTHLLSAGFDSTLRLWHVADRKLLRTIDIGTFVEKMVPLPDGRRVMLSGAHTRGWGPRIYDLEKGEKTDATLNGYSCMAVSTDGRMSLIGSLTGVLVVRDTVNDKVIVQMTDPRAVTARDRAARDAAITPDGRFAITTTREKQMHLWDLHQGKLLSTAELDSVSTISLSPDGRFALTIGQGGISIWRLPESVLEPIAAAPAPVGAKAEMNLLSDPSFENTPLTQLPSDWRVWLSDGQEFRCEVVAGGQTGQRCLKISGRGTRGVVFANDMKADRSKRYALKGWAKFEGDKDARAIIKFNYFRGSEFLGAHDLVGVTADQPGWHLLEKTDTLDVYPQADHFYAMCHVEGSGTGWFDDLELVAYDRDKLPEDFDARHGRHNRLHGPNSLVRWVGAWETEYVFREFDNSPKETKLTMNAVSERTLGDYFLISHAKKSPQASGAASAPRSGGDETVGLTPPRSPGIYSDERLLFLTFDQNLGAFRQWFFSSNGKVFEWRGPWNQEKQTLELRMLPDASNLHSSEHFVDDDHIEAKLWFQYVMGQRDAGRWTATRKAVDGKVDVPTATSHVAEPAELSQLNKFAGEWTIHAKYKPSVWNPQPREETIRETSVWILGGRFLMTRAFNEKDELTSIWIATWEPSEKSNRFWFFNADGSSGEWRLTWDETSSGFHFRAADIPSGWTGTGFNRWVDEDTFDNQALIKDQNGQVLLDSTQERRRKK